MAYPSTPNRLEAVFVQRDATNVRYDQINISGSDLIVYLDGTGSINADKISVWAEKYNIGGGGSSGSAISCSWASQSLSSSYSQTSSWAFNVISASYASTASFAYVAISASYFSGSQITASSILVNLILPGSSSIGSPSQPFSTIYVAQMFGTSSWATASISASHAIFSDTASISLSSPTSTSSSFATSASHAITADTSSYISSSATFDKTVYNLTSSAAISASHALFSDSASVALQANTASFVTASNVFGTVVSASYSNSASYAPAQPTVSASYSSTSSISISSSIAVTASFSPTGRSIVLCSAFTPIATGADLSEIAIPYSPYDGTTPVAWTVKRLVFRAQTAANDTSSVNIEKSSGTGAFSGTTVGSVVLPSGSYEAATTGSFSINTLSSDDKVRFNVTTLGSALNWTVIVELSNTGTPITTSAPQIFNVARLFANYTASLTDYTLICFPTASNISILLPTASYVGTLYNIKKGGTSSFSVSVAGTENIDGQSSLLITGSYGYSTIQSDGFQWWII